MSEGDVLSEAEDTSEVLCRICREEGSPSRPLITPCACKGSVAHVHKECLDTWLRVRPTARDAVAVVCELCGSEFEHLVLQETYWLNVCAANLGVLLAILFSALWNVYVQALPQLELSLMQSLALHTNDLTTNVASIDPAQAIRTSPFKDLAGELFSLCLVALVVLWTLATKITCHLRVSPLWQSMDTHFRIPSSRPELPQEEGGPSEVVLKRYTQATWSMFGYSFIGYVGCQVLNEVILSGLPNYVRYGFHYAAVGAAFGIADRLPSTSFTYTELINFAVPLLLPKHLG